MRPNDDGASACDADPARTPTSPNTPILHDAACICKATATCNTCANWASILDATAMRRAERLGRLLEVAEQRGAVLTGARLWMPRRGNWRPYQLRDLDSVEALVNRLCVRGVR